ncbi:hypothetical protein Tco_1361250 [Tanacetum coccineum]
MAGNSFSKSLMKSKSSKELTVGLGDGSKGILTLSLSFSESVFKLLTEIILRTQEWLLSDGLTCVVKDYSWDSVSTDLRS